MTDLPISMDQFIRWHSARWHAALGDAAASAGATIPIDVIESGQDYLLTAEIPGSARELIQVALDGGQVTINVHGRAVAAHSPYRPLLVERVEGARSRTVTLPQSIDKENAHGFYRDGVLLLHLPKLGEGARPLQIGS